jgi:hypothetical protein
MSAYGPNRLIGDVCCAAHVGETNILYPAEMERELAELRYQLAKPDTQDAFARAPSHPQ